MTGEDAEKPRISGYGFGKVDTIVTVEDVAREAALLAETAPSGAEIAALAGGSPLLTIAGLVAGYGKMEILHGIDLQIAAGQSLCLVGPNGAGESTVLHSIYGFTRIFGGGIAMAGADITSLPASAKLRDAGIAYVLQDNSVFPEMSVEENLWMGGYLMGAKPAKAAAERIFAKYPRLAERRAQP